MIDLKHGHCFHFCEELAKEAEILEKQNNGSTTIAHAIFSVGTVVVQILEEIAHSQARIARALEQQAGIDAEGK